MVRKQRKTLVGKKHDRLCPMALLAHVPEANFVVAQPVRAQGVKNGRFACDVLEFWARARIQCIAAGVGDVLCVFSQICRQLSATVGNCRLVSAETGGKSGHIYCRPKRLTFEPHALVPCARGRASSAVSHMCSWQGPRQPTIL